MSGNGAGTGTTCTVTGGNRYRMLQMLRLRERDGQCGAVGDGNRYLSPCHSLLVTVADGVCYPMSAALIISRQRRRIYPDHGRAECRSQTNENNNRDREIRPVQSATVLSDRARLVAVTGGDSTGVSQTDAGQPWAAAVAAWLVIHGVVAGMHCESQWRLWDVRHTGGGRLERRVERWAAE